MKISDLLRVMTYSQTYFANSKVIEHYGQFNSVLTQNLQGQVTQSLAPFQENLYNAFRSSNLSDFTFNQVQIVQKYNVRNLFGQEAVDYIENILRDQNFDRGGVIQKTTAHLQQFQSFHTMANQIVSNLGVLRTETADEVYDNRANLQLNFVSKAEIKNIVELNKWFEDWHLTLRNFGMLYDVRPEEILIGQAEKSSPLWLDILGPITVIGAIAKASTYILDNIEKIFKIKNLIVQTKNLNLNNEKLEKELVEEAKAAQEKAAAEVTEKVINESEPTAKMNGEIKSAIKIGVEKLFLFLEFGGKMEFHFKAKVGEETTPENQQKIDEFKSAASSIHRKQAEIEAIRQIEAPK
jgi:outer membrane murein-binding lipoprotein Lpp